MQEHIKENYMMKCCLFFFWVFWRGGWKCYSTSKCLLNICLSCVGSLAICIVSAKALSVMQSFVWGCAFSVAARRCKCSGTSGSCSWPRPPVLAFQTQAHYYPYSPMYIKNNEPVLLFRTAPQGQARRVRIPSGC